MIPLPLRVMNKHPLFSQKGLGMAEAIIASALLLITSLGVVSYLNSAKQLNMKLEGQPECRAVAVQVLNKFKNDDHRLNTSNWHSIEATQLKPANSEAELGRPALGHYTRFNKFNIVDDPANVTASNTNAWLLPNTAANWALTLYNEDGFAGGADSGICDITANARGRDITNSHALTDEFLPTSGNPLKDQKVYLNIQRIDTITQTTDCTNVRGTQKIIPKGKRVTTDSDFGLKIITTITYTDRNNTTQQCTGETVLKPGGDPYSPVATEPDSSIKPTGAIDVSGNRSGIFINNDPQNMAVGGASGLLKTRFNGGNVWTAIAYNETAVVISCHLSYSTTPPAALTGGETYQFCNSFTSNPAGSTGKGHALQTTGAANRSQTGINVRLSELSKGYYTISFIAYDQAQNQSAPTTTSFCVFECPDPSTYCPGAEPDDGCGDACPIGTKVCCVAVCPDTSTCCTQ